MVFEALQRISLILVGAVVLGVVWRYAGRGRWREALTDRFVYGVPWGSLITILLVVGFYLFAQSGLESWSDPVVIAFRSWSYDYLFGMLAAGFAHSGPSHLMGNMVGAAVLSPLVEYAWGHYPPSAREQRENADHTTQRESEFAATQREPEYAYPPPGELPPVVDEPQSTSGGFFSRPLVRALIVFPVAVIIISILTSFFARGWSLGYSGTVFFFLGFAAVKLPLATVVGVVVMSGVNVLFSAFQTPIVTAGLSTGAPSPPSWAGVNVQAHILGFLLGVVLAFELSRRREEWPRVGYLALAVVTVALAQQLWSISGSGGGTFVRYQALGVVFVFFLSLLVISMVSIENETVYGRLTVRGLIGGGIVLIIIVVAMSSVQFNLPGMADDPVPEGGVVEIEDYSITYTDSAPHGRVSGNSSGVIVVSEEREIWAQAVSRNRLAFDGEGSVTVGGLGWRETVDVERHAWNVAGNETVYAVSLEHDERVHAFDSPSKEAGGSLVGHTFSLRSTPDGFTVEVRVDNERVGETAVPDRNETTTVALSDPASVSELTVTTRERDGTDELFVESEGTRVLVATKG